MSSTMLILWCQFYLRHRLCIKYLYCRHFTTFYIFMEWIHYARHWGQEELQCNPVLTLRILFLHRLCMYCEPPIHTTVCPFHRLKIKQQITEMTFLKFKHWPVLEAEAEPAYTGSRVHWLNDWGFLSWEEIVSALRVIQLLEKAKILKKVLYMWMNIMV